MWSCLVWPGFGLVWSWCSLALALALSGHGLVWPGLGLVWSWSDFGHGLALIMVWCWSGLFWFVCGLVVVWSGRGLVLVWFGRGLASLLRLVHRAMTPSSPRSVTSRSLYDDPLRDVLGV